MGYEFCISHGLGIWQNLEQKIFLGDASKWEEIRSTLGIVMEFCFRAPLNVLRCVAYLLAGFSI